MAEGKDGTKRVVIVCENSKTVYCIVASLSTRSFEILMKTIKIDDVHFQMLVDLSKRCRMKPNSLIEDLIQETYASKAKRKSNNSN